MTMAPGTDLLLDVRGLEPPEPLEQVFGALERLGPDERLRIILDIEPRPLFPLLKISGYLYQSQATALGAYEVVIWRED